MGVMIYDTEQDDFYPVWKLDKAYKDDEIDEGHPLLLIQKYLFPRGGKLVGKVKIMNTYDPLTKTWDLTEFYFDSDGKEHKTLESMCRAEPEWAANQIRKNKSHVIVCCENEGDDWLCTVDGFNFCTEAWHDSKCEAIALGLERFAEICRLIDGKEQLR